MSDHASTNQPGASMSKLEQAARQALAALERADKISGYANNKRAIASLESALAEQPVAQEPAIYPDEAFDMGLEAIPYYTAPQPAIPSGYKLVPIEPTPGMLVAINWPNDPTGYRAMLAAAPQQEGETK